MQGCENSLGRVQHDVERTIRVGGREGRGWGKGPRPFFVVQLGVGKWESWLAWEEASESHSLLVFPLVPHENRRYIRLDPRERVAR